MSIITKILVANPMDRGSLERLTSELNEMRATLAEVKVTYLQSSATTTRHGERSFIESEHVLTAVVQWESSPALAQGRAQRPPVTATRTARTR